MFVFLFSFTLCFLQGLTPDLPAAKTSAAVNQKHSPAPECNGESYWELLGHVIDPVLPVIQNVKMED